MSPIRDRQIGHFVEVGSCRRAGSPGSGSRRNRPVERGEAVGGQRQPLTVPPGAITLQDKAKHQPAVERERHGEANPLRHQLDRAWKSTCDSGHLLKQGKPDDSCALEHQQPHRPARCTARHRRQPLSTLAQRRPPDCGEARTTALIRQAGHLRQAPGKQQPENNPSDIRPAAPSRRRVTVDRRSAITDDSSSSGRPPGRKQLPT